MSRPLPRSGLGATDHDEPFHDSTNGSDCAPVTIRPTATHVVELTHDTERSELSPVPTFGLGTTDHTEPFHESTRVVSCTPDIAFPTATHEAADTHDTDSR